MLYRLSVENFGALRDRQVLDLTISGKVEHDPDRHLVGPDRLRAPKVAVVLGANASGKTTVLRALEFLADFATRSALYPSERSLPFQPFRDIEASREPSVLSVEFTADWVTPGIDRPFRYTLTAQPGEQYPFQRIVEKELFEYRPGIHWVTLIDRREGRAVFRREFGRLGGTVPQTALARRNASVLSLLGQFVPENHIVRSIHSALSTVVSNFKSLARQRRSEAQVAEVYAQEPSSLEALNRLIRKADLGIRDVSIEEMTSAVSDAKRWILLFSHSGLSGALPSRFESQGTMNFVSLFPTIHSALVRGGLALMDEMDSDLHPELLKEIVGWFTDPEINKTDAQLLTTCNNPSILDFLQKEEIFFARKDDVGRTSVYALKDIPGVRRNANFHRDYLAGRYGAIPHIG